MTENFEFLSSEKLQTLLSEGGQTFTSTTGTAPNISSVSTTSKHNNSRPNLVIFFVSSFIVFDASFENFSKLLHQQFLMVTKILSMLKGSSLILQMQSLLFFSPKKLKFQNNSAQNRIV